MQSTFMKWLRRKLGREDVTEEEIMSMVNEGHEQGVIEAEEVEMINNIFEFDDIVAAEYEIAKAVDDVLAVIDFDLTIHMGMVADNDVRLAVELHMGGEAGATGAYDTRRLAFVVNDHTLSSPLILRVRREDRSYSMSRAPRSVQRRVLVKVRALVSPSPVGVAMVKVVNPSPPKPMPA